MSESIQTVMQKLKLIGADIICWNNFGIAYNMQSKKEMVKFTYDKTGNIIKTDYYNGYSCVGMSKYFIQLNYGSGLARPKLFVGTSDKDIVANEPKIYTNFDSDVAYYYGSWYDSPILICETYTDRIKAINYKGKKIDITYKFGDEEGIRVCIRKVPKGRFQLGYAKIKYGISSTYDVNIGIGEPDWFLEIDAEFKKQIHNPRIQKQFF